MGFPVGESQSSTTMSYGPLTDASMDTYRMRVNETANNLYNSGGMPISPTTETQSLARDAAVGMVYDSGKNWANDIAGAGSGYSANTVSGDDITKNINPFMQSVGRDTVRGMNREHQNNSAQIGARAAASGAFSGSGSAAALQRGIADRGYNQDVGDTINQISSQAFDNAQNLALANAQMENSAAQFNAGQQLSANIAASDTDNSVFDRQMSAFDALMAQNTFEKTRDDTNALSQVNLLDWYKGTNLPMPGATQTETTPNYVNPLGLAGLL